MTIRQPIVTVCGHVDHGKTSILDSIRGTCVQTGEAGGITQKISFTSYPANQIKKSCFLLERSGIKLDIPGFLFIDTPGHAAFSNLRKRGGSLADLAILVIDINEGIKPQTAEVIQILKLHKTPFIIALNKIDKISGWRTISREKTDNPVTSEVASGTNKDKPIKESIETQATNVKQNFDEKYLTLVGSLNSYGFDSDLFYNISDFTKKIALVPCSARTKEGLQELIMVLCGLSQKYLTDKLKLGKEAKGVILEVKKEKTIHYIEAILYDGELSRTNEIAIANFTNQEEPIITKIRILEEIQPLCSKFKTKEKVTASTGIRMQLIEKTEVLPGMPFVLYKGNKQEVKESFKKQIGENIITEKKGIIAKADSLGSLEALLILLKQSNIPVVKVGIGSINKTDIINAKANLETDETDAVIAGFNVELDEDAKLILENDKRIKLTKDEIIYKLIENIVKIRDETRREVEKKRLMELTTICKLTILHQHVFRNSNPAIFGVRVEGGKLTSNLGLIDNDGIKIARVKNIQSENKSVEEATETMEVAISLPGTNFERQLGDKKFLYSDLGETQFKKFKKNKDLLSEKEIKILSEIAEIKRKKKTDWGM